MTPEFLEPSTETDKKLFLNGHVLGVISNLMLKKNTWVPTADQHLFHHFMAD